MSRAVIPDLWDEAHAAGLDEPGLLLYRSNLLGSDLRITNFGGGGASALVETADPLTGEMVKALWVKGSGGDLGSIERDGFATLYPEDVAEAAYFLASDAAAKSTDDIVVAADAVSFTR